MSIYSYLPVNWPQAGNNSQAYSLAHGNQIIGFFTQPTLTSTALTFLVGDIIDASATSGKVGGFRTLKAAVGGSDISFTVVASKYYGFTADLINQFSGIKNFKIAGGSSENVGEQIILVLQDT